MTYFKKNTKLYLVRNGLRYEMEVYPDISFSQTYAETAIPTKTLHNQTSFFENAVITQAAPANFNFTIPALSSTHLRIIYTLLVSHEIREGTPSLLFFDLYHVNDGKTIKLENAVLDSGIFQISQGAPLTLSIGGTASKLSLFTDALPGTLQTVPPGTGYVILRALETKIGAVTLDQLTALTIELKNNNVWMGYDSIHSIATQFSETAYPRNCFLQDRVLSGTIEQNASASSYTHNWSVGESISVKAGTTIGSPLIEMLIPSAVYNARINPGGDLITRGIDFRMLSTATALSDVLKMNQS